MRIVLTLTALLFGVSVIAAFFVPGERLVYIAPVPTLSFEALKNIAASKLSTAVNFTESFSKTYVLEERWPMRKSGDTNWWVSSGAYMYFDGGTGRTIFGDLSPSDPWAAKFSVANPQDTKNGLRPQNIFRLVLKKKADNFTQSVYGKIGYYETSTSTNRNASNGILLFNRYQDEYTLYYAGVRVDGKAIVKKKLAGTYYTLGEALIFPGAYNRVTNPNLLPLDTWIGIKTDVATDTQGRVIIKLYTDIGKTGVWQLALTAVDDGVTNGNVITASGYGGIRTDFMDVTFDDYTFKSLVQ